MPEETPPVHLAKPSTAQPEPSLSPEVRRGLIIGGVLLLLLLAVIVIAVIWLLRPENAAFTTVLRDVFIILLALESMFIGLALLILMVQVARLTNLLQHEIKPILENTNDTIATVRSTAIFVSENLVDPVTKLNSYMAAIGRFFELINVLKKK